MISNKKYNLLSIFKISLKVYPIYIVILLITIVLNGLFNPINLLVMQKFIDNILSLVKNHEGYIQVIPLFILIILLQIYRHFNNTPEYFLGIKFNHKIKKYFLGSIIDKISRLEYHHIENRDTYNLIHRVKKGAEINIKGSLLHLSKIVSGIINVIGLFVIIWKAGSIISLSILLVILITTFFSYKCATRTFEVNVGLSEAERKGDYYEGIFKDRSIAPEIKLFRASEYIIKLFLNNEEEILKKYYAMELRNRPNTWILLRFIGYLLLLFTYIILLFPLSNNLITIGFYIATVNAISRLVEFITESAPESLQYLFESNLYWKEVSTFFNLSEKLNEVNTNNNSKSFNVIKFNNVYFKYPHTNQYILKGVSFTIEKGKHYAIVGKNGAGKSTIIKLLTGLYEVSSGEITIDGVNINHFSANELSSLLSVVFQDFGKYQITVLDNIKLTDINSNTDMNKINSIANNLGFLETIKRMPEGYDTILGKLTKKGIDISGGEWQKLTLCRSIYSNTAIRILDEPTSALDPEAESKLYKLFEDSLTKDSSTILISHRLGSTKLANDIILIDDGIVKEQGSHEELIKINGIYKKMFDSQKLWYS